MRLFMTMPKAGQQRMKPKLKHRWSIGHNYMTGITFGAWMRLLMQNRFHISPAYLHRAAFITFASLANSASALAEAVVYGKAIERTEIKNAPVFILGHWRSGTTLLHDLLAQDTAQFNFANTYQVVNPRTFLLTENFFTRMLSRLLPPTRPMDNMALTFTSAQEDEFAPLLISLMSVYLGISFPKRTPEYEKYLSFTDVPRADVEKWQAAFMFFCKKLSLHDDRALLLKSPPHTARIRILLEMFPDARFVHIHRDPYRVFESQRHFFDTAGWYTYLQRPDLDAIDEGILQRHETMYDAYFEDAPLIPKGRFCELRFTDLEADPARAIAKIYDALSLDFSPQYQADLNTYVASLRGYRKNDFSGLDDATKTVVAKRWRRSFEHGDYPV